MLVPNRHGSSNSYRYGFNGKENDNEVMGEGNFQDYGMRMYNPRLGRFPSVDPLTKSFAYLTPYQYASNSPIAMIDFDGMEGSLGISGSANVISIGTPIVEFDYDRDLSPDYNSEFYKASIVNFAFMGSVGITIVSAPQVISAYESYSTWFGTTQLSNSFAGVGVTGGTGASIYSLLEAPFTFSGASNFTITKFGVGFTSDVGGQLLFGSDEINIFSSTMSGFSVVNPFYANGFGSMGEINISKNGITTSVNLFDGKFASNVTSNFIGGRVSNGFEVSGIGYKPAENGLNLFTGSIIESGENKLGDKLSKAIETTKTEMSSSKKSKGTKTREPVKNEKVKSSIPTTQKIRTDLIKIKS